MRAIANRIPVDRNPVEADSLAIATALAGVRFSVGLGSGGDKGMAAAIPWWRVPMNSNLMRHHGTGRLACIGVTCAFGLLIGLFLWLIAESLLGLR